jgi:hypothetical protein
VHKIFDASGDSDLKNTRHIRENHYIGSFESRQSLDSAFENALYQAHMQIISDLGIRVAVTSASVFRSLETTNYSQYKELINQNIVIQGEHSIQTRITRLYSEKQKVGGNIVYKYWVELYFDKEGFLSGYESFWAGKLSQLRPYSRSNISATFIKNFEEILSLRDRFEKEKRYLSRQVVDDFQAVSAQYRSTFNANFHNVAVTNIAGEGRFSNSFHFRIINKATNEALGGLPIQIRERAFYTTASGTLTYKADYNHEVTVFLGHNLSTHIDQQTLIIYKNDSFSPLQNKNISIVTRSSEKQIESQINRILEKNGYRMGGSPDITLEVIPRINTKMISIGQYITELRLEIRILSQGRLLRTVNVPQNQAEFINGFGRTETDAKNSAFHLEYNSRVNEIVDTLQRNIRDVLMSR